MTARLDMDGIGGIGGLRGSRSTKAIRPEQLERLRSEFPQGARVELVRMDDAQAPAIGTRGTVLGVDDTGSLLVDWDDGSGLNVIWGVDEARRVVTGMPDTVREQVLAIRDTGLVNMFDVTMVQRLAFDRDYHDLVCYLEEHRGEYARFIMTGEA